MIPYFLDKWKYLIIGGTIACFLVAVIISFAMPKIYCIDTIIEPGILSIIRKIWSIGQILSK